MELWIHRWEKNGWKTKKGDVLNRDLLEQIKILQSRIKVYFEKVDGHSGDYNNNQADLLAKEGAKLYTR
jgi:ribonuclease HI